MTRTHLVTLLVTGTLLAGCAQLQRIVPQRQPAPDRTAAAEVAVPEAPEEVAAVVSDAGRAEALPANRRTAEDFDTTTAEERAVAVAAAERAPEESERLLGTTVASLGDATEPGLWMRTPLVDAVTQGRVADPGRGTTVLVELRPLSGAASGGSQISLAALRLLEVPLTDLPTVEVYAR